MDIVIEKGIPLPKKLHRGGRDKAKVRLAMEAMEVGESFLWPEEKRGAVLMLAWKYLRPKRFTTESQDDGTVRVWRKE